MGLPSPNEPATAVLQGSITNFMNSNPKAGGVAHLEQARGFYRVAIVGAASLKGKEVAEVLDERNFPSSEVKLLDDDDALGQLEALKDEVTFIQSVRKEQFEQVDFTFFASDAKCTRSNWKNVQKSGSAIVDLSYALEDEPGASLRAPWVERQLGQTFAPELQPGPAVVAHPIAVVLTLLLLRIHAAVSVKRAVVTVFEPASEQGQKGMDELHQQTVNLLSFQQLPKKIFDAQVAFNMLASYGSESAASLGAVHDRVVRHYKKIAGERAPLPSLLVVQAPIFHGHAFAINLQFQGPAAIDPISSALAGEHVSLQPSSEESPTNVSAAGQGDILVSVSPDSSDPNSLWLWATSDNLRVAASTAVEAAEGIAASRPRGTIQ
jgi:aspartate-semialdehyde dehydrogenase